MARNASVIRFAKLTADLKTEVRDEAIGGVLEQALALAGVMRQLAPQGPTGNLKRSVRAEVGNKPTTALVKAGGALTTREVRSGSGVPFDYSLAVEFGTHEQHAQPFFWPTYRLTKKRARRAIKRRITKAINARSSE